MNDALLFHSICAEFFGKSGGPSRTLLAFLNSNGMSSEAVSYATLYTLSSRAEVGSGYFYDESYVLNLNDAIPIALQNGLLIVGNCPNDDLIVLDVRDRLGECGYVGHETMWQEPSLRNAFVVVAPSLGELVQGLRDRRLPCDYYEATKSSEQRD